MYDTPRTTTGPDKQRGRGTHHPDQTPEPSPALRQTAKKVYPLLDEMEILVDEKMNPALKDAALERAAAIAKAIQFQVNPSLHPTVDAVRTKLIWDEFQAKRSLLETLDEDAIATFRDLIRVVCENKKSHVIFNHSGRAASDPATPEAATTSAPSPDKSTSNEAEQDLPKAIRKIQDALNDLLTSSTLALEAYLDSLDSDARQEPDPQKRQAKLNSIKEKDIVAEFSKRRKKLCRDFFLLSHPDRYPPKLKPFAAKLLKAFLELRSKFENGDIQDMSDAPDIQKILDNPTDAPTPDRNKPKTQDFHGYFQELVQKIDELQKRSEAINTGIKEGAAKLSALRLVLRNVEEEIQRGDLPMDAINPLREEMRMLQTHIIDYQRGWQELDTLRNQCIGAYRPYQEYLVSAQMYEGTKTELSQIEATVLRSQQRLAEIGNEYAALIPQEARANNAFEQARIHRYSSNGPLGLMTAEINNLTRARRGLSVHQGNYNSPDGQRLIQIDIRLHQLNAEHARQSAAAVAAYQQAREAHVKLTDKKAGLERERQSLIVHLHTLAADMSQKQWTLQQQTAWIRDTERSLKGVAEANR